MLISDVSSLFKQGKALTSATTWANSTTLTGVLTGFLIALFHVARLFGYDFGVDDATLTQMAGGVAAFTLVVTNVVHTLANPAAGVRADGEAGPSAGNVPNGGGGPG